jgi:Mce-associated membrane protein
MSVEDRQQAIDAASEAAQAIVAADYRNYDDEIEQATRLMTPSFAAKYLRTSDDIRGEFIQHRTVIDATVATSGLSGISTTKAQVLVFLNQTSERLPAPGASTAETIATPYALTVHLERSNDEWLVDGLDTDTAPQSDEPDPARREALHAADRLVTAFSNFDYRNPQVTFDAVLDGSTGLFREQYEAGMDELRNAADNAQSRLEARVRASGIVSFEADTATIIVVTQGEVFNKVTKFRPEPRNYRIQVVMSRVDGEWLASELQYVAVDSAAAGA